MVGKCEPQYSGEPKHYMNMSRNNNNNNEESEMQLCDYQQYTECEPESLSITPRKDELYLSALVRLIPPEQFLDP